MDLYTRRKLTNGVNLGLSMAAMAFGLFWLGWILWTLLHLGLAWLSPSVLFHATPPPGEGGGGLANAILGSLLMTSVAVAIGTPVGILSATFLVALLGGRHILLHHFRVAPLLVRKNLPGPRPLLLRRGLRHH